MRIGIDMLGVQSPWSRGRGIGRYTEEIVRQLLTHHESHRFTLYFYEHLPYDEHLYGSGPHQVRHLPWDRGAEHLGAVVERLAEQNPDGLDVLVITTPMETYERYYPPRKPLNGLRCACIFYDLIPVLFQERYLAHANTSQWYYDALSRVSGYDALLCISEATCNDVRRVLAIPPERAVNVGAASDGTFFAPPAQRPPCARTRDILAEVGITKPFLYSVCGMDDRKNFRGIINAFAQLPSALREAYQLVLTCKMQPAEADYVRNIARSHNVDQQLVLSNYISDETLRALYQHCELFVLPSTYEGFGLPILEAMLCGAPVIAGNNSSQVELVQGVGLLVNVHDAADISDKMRLLLEDADLAERCRRRSLEHARDYSWEITAERSLAALTRPTAGRNPVEVPGAGPRGPKPLIAYFSPFPPKKSGIADYSASLLEELKAYYSIDLYHDACYVPDTGLKPHGFRCFDHRLFERRSRLVNYHAVVYQMGNSEYHRFIYERLLRTPGVVTLHDLFLGEFHWWYSGQPGVQPGHLAREIEYELGGTESGQSALERWSSGPQFIVERLRTQGVHLTKRVLDQATAVIVHQEAGLQQLARRAPEHLHKLAVVPMGAVPREPNRERGQQVRARFGLPAEALILGSFGIIAPTKLNLEAIEAFAPLAQAHPQALLILVGQELDNGAARARVADLDLTARVRFFSYCSQQDFDDLLSVVDVGVNLRRPPTNGETSASLLQLMGNGVPTVVTDVGTFATYPKGTVYPVPYDGNFVASLCRAYFDLAYDAEQRSRMGMAALEHIRSEHTWARTARRYASFIELQARSSPWNGRNGENGLSRVLLREASAPAAEAAPLQLVLATAGGAGSELDG